ncbi:MAG: hypothetical protein NVSMB27_22600 [Ktedonobacteraceae bacterium]
MANRIHGKSRYGRDSRAKAGEDAELGRAASGSIGVGMAPSEERSAINNGIACAYQLSTDGAQNTEDKEGLWEWCCGLLPTFALLGGARDAGAANFAQWQTAGQARNQSHISW